MQDDVTGDGPHPFVLSSFAPVSKLGIATALSIFFPSFFFLLPFISFSALVAWRKSARTLLEIRHATSTGSGRFTCPYHIHFHAAPSHGGSTLFTLQPLPPLTIKTQRTSASPPIFVRSFGCFGRYSLGYQRITFSGPELSSSCIV